MKVFSLFFAEEKKIVDHLQQSELKDVAIQLLKDPQFVEQSGGGDIRLLKHDANRMLLPKAPNKKDVRPVSVFPPASMKPKKTKTSKKGRPKFVGRPMKLKPRKARKPKLGKQLKGKNKKGKNLKGLKKAKNISKFARPMPARAKVRSLENPRKQTRRNNKPKRKGGKLRKQSTGKDRKTSVKRMRDQILSLAGIARKINKTAAERRKNKLVNKKRPKSLRSRSRKRQNKKLSGPKKEMVQKISKGTIKPGPNMKLSSSVRDKMFRKQQRKPRRNSAKKTRGRKQRKLSKKLRVAEKTNPIVSSVKV